MIHTWLRGRLQIVVSASVVVSFLLAAGAAWLRANTIEGDVADIVGNAMPSVELLSQARTDLRRLELSFEQFAQRPGAIGNPRLAVRSARRNLDASLATYRALPYFPAEQGLDRDVQDDLARLDNRLEDATRCIDKAAPCASTAVDEVDDAIEQLDRALSRIIEFDATQGQRLGLSVGWARRSAAYIALVLNGIAIGLAAFATALAVRSVSKDMHALEQARDSASERATKSEQRSVELEQFAGRVAHDIVSPLTAVSMACELTKLRMSSDAKSEEMLDRGLRSLARVRRIVDGLLDFARAGAKPGVGASADLAEVVDDVAEEARAEAQAAGIELVIAPIPSCVVACSPGALTSIVANLVRNAVKHMGDAQTRFITVRATTSNDAVRLEIEDTGPGVPADIEATLFEPFIRGASNVAGLGLGLATVKRLAVAHGGRVGCRTRVGVGSTFWFELPPVSAAASDEHALLSA